MGLYWSHWTLLDAYKMRKHRYESILYLANFFFYNQLEIAVKPPCRQIILYISSSPSSSYPNLRSPYSYICSCSDCLVWNYKCPELGTHFTRFFFFFIVILILVPAEATVVLQEHLNKWYSLPAYCITKILMDLPVQVKSSNPYYITLECNYLSFFFI